MISDIWEEKKAEWEMKDIAVLFNLSIPQVYRIIKEQIPIIGKVVPDKRLGNKVIFKKK